MPLLPQDRECVWAHRKSRTLISPSEDEELEKLAKKVGWNVVVAFKPLPGSRMSRRVDMMLLMSGQVEHKAAHNRKTKRAALRKLSQFSRRQWRFERRLVKAELPELGLF